MRRIPALALLLASALAGAEPAADPMAATRKAEEELRQLAETPLGKREQELARTISEADRRHSEEMSALYRQSDELRNAADYKALEAKRREIQARRASAWEVERKAMAEAARALYAARHAELGAQAERETSAPPSGFEPMTFPRIDGSTSTHPLGVIIASRVLGTGYEWLYPEPTGNPWARAKTPRNLLLDDVGPRMRGFDGEDEDYDFTLAASRTVAKPRQPAQERTAILINSLLAVNRSTHLAFVNLVGGRSDLILTARAPSADEQKLAAEKGVAIALQPIARDALVFFVNHRNPVKGVTSAQIRSIYGGGLSDWQELGGPPGRISALWRERNSGSRELFDALVGKDGPIAEPSGDRARGLFSDSMSGPFNRVTQESGCIGYSVHYYEHFMAMSPYTRTLAVDGVEPSAATIADGTYPYVAEVFVAYRTGDPEDGPARRLAAWLVSPAGQAVVRESGYVPVK